MFYGDRVERRAASLREVVDPNVQEGMRIRQFDGRELAENMLLAGLRKFAKVDQENRREETLSRSARGAAYGRQATVR